MTMLKPRSGMKLTVEEFFALPETMENPKMELDEGVLYIMVKPRLVHQFFQGRLSFYFESYLEEFEEPPAHVFTEVITALSLERRTLFAPDLSIVLVHRSHLLTGRMIEGPPDIVVEILSTDRNRDLVRQQTECVRRDAEFRNTGFSTLPTIPPTLLELRNGEYDRARVLTVDD